MDTADINCIKPGISTSRLNGSSTANCITVNDNEEIPLEDTFRDEAKKQGAIILQQFVFSDKNKYSSSFKNLISRGAPFLCLNQNYPDNKGTFSSQAIAISGMRNIKTVQLDNRKFGSVYEDEYARYCFLSNVFSNDINASRQEQTQFVFETFDKAMSQHGFNFSETVRTWFYNDHILDWYGEFNKVRTDFFNKTGIFNKTVPASTGIGTGNPHGAALIGSAFAIQAKTPEVRIQSVESPMQSSALTYKSSFSRAVELTFPLSRALLISGTASIDKDGKSVHIDDPQRQIELTMRVVEELLHSRKMNWNNVFRGIVYFKHHDYLKYFEDYCRNYEISMANMAVAFTDICRKDLLFEIELDALISK